MEFLKRFLSFLIGAGLVGMSHGLAVESGSTGLRMSVPSLRESRAEVSAGSALGAFSGAVGWGVDAGISVPLRGPAWMAMGLDVGFYRWDFGGATDPYRSFSVAVTDTSATTLLLLPTFRFRFELPGLYGFYPQLGVSLGSAIYRVEGTSKNDGSRLRETRLLGTLWLRPGIFFNLSPRFGLGMEAKLGALRGETLLLSEISANWVL